jgi:hypothetical protein
VLRAHVDEMAHDLVKELRGGQGSGGAELDFSKRPAWWQRAIPSGGLPSMPTRRNPAKSKPGG